MHFSGRSNGRLQPTGTSGKFVNMMVQALEEFQEYHKVKLDKVTKIPLEGEGTIDGRVERCDSFPIKSDRYQMMLMEIFL